MAHLEEDIIKRAKNTDMIALLESEEGFSFKSTYGEREFKCIEHNSLVVNGNRRRWYWNSRQVGGNNAIDYLVKIRGRISEMPYYILSEIGSKRHIRR